MTIPPIASSAISLGFEPQALERCFLVADILLEDFAEPLAEYALLGLSTQADPFHVVATPLLSGQCVTKSTVHQSGHQVLRMRDEIEALSSHMRQRLVPIAFIHRHPRRCDASRTDEEFLRGVFVDQVSTVVSFEEASALYGLDRPCECPDAQCPPRRTAGREGGHAALRGEIGVAFSLIVNRDREHRLYAARRRSCPACDHVEVRDVPARLALDPQRSVSARDRAALRGQLCDEISDRIHFGRDPRVAEAIR